MRVAEFWTKQKDNSVRCELCPHRCLTPPGRTGICHIRENRKGKMIPLTYSRISSASLDPIEKKPLFRFLPGTTIYSLGSLGCNLGCFFCQNWEIAHPEELGFDSAELMVREMTRELTPEKAVKIALGYSKIENCCGIAYTYNEPFIWFEYVHDTAVLAREAGLKNVLVTNGFVNKEPLKRLLPLIDAMNIDLKSIKPEGYKKLKGKLEPVLQTISLAVKSCHVELTNLIVPGLNDSDQDFEELTSWILNNAGTETPLHFSRYFPRFKSDAPPTPPETLEKARAIALKKLKHVYLGNVVA